MIIPPVDVRAQKRTSLERINGVILSPHFEQALVKHGIDMMEFQATWGKYGNTFDDLPRPYKLAILDAEVKVFGYAQTYMASQEQSQWGLEDVSPPTLKPYKSYSREIVPGDPNLAKHQVFALWCFLGFVFGVIATLAVVYSR